MAVEHTPVLLQQVLEAFAPLAPGMRVCDATLGDGGHAAALLERCPRCEFVGIDVDAAMVHRAASRLASASALTIVNRWSDEVIGAYGRFDRILVDLGVSMVHMRSPERGFSFRHDGPLDMRLDTTAGPSAAQLIATIGEHELAEVIHRFGQERYARRIARAICQRPRPRTTAELADAVRRVYPPAQRHGRIHPATRTFQALRIAVNRELERAERIVARAAAALAPGGRLAIVSFHSLEDRIVKHGFRALAGASSSSGMEPMNKIGAGYVVRTKKPIRPTEEEIRRNPAARSAKLRVLERET